MATVQPRSMVLAPRPLPGGVRAAALPAWAREHPAQSLLRGALLVLMFCVGALAGSVLAYGPLDGDPALMIALGVLGGLFSSGLTMRQGMAAVRGDAAAARRWRWGLLAGYLVAALSIAVVSSVQVYNSGELAPINQDRVANFERLWAAVRDNYPRASGDVKWEELHDRYLPLVRSASDDRAYLTAVADALGELRDEHTRLDEPQLNSFFALTAEIEGKAIVTAASQAARQAGLDTGAVVMRVGGKTVGEAIEALPPRLLNASTPQSRRYKAFDGLLLVPPSGTLEVQFETPAGELRSVTLAVSSSAPAGASDGPDPDEPLVTGRRLGGSFGLIRVPTFTNEQGHDIVAEFDAALDRLMDAPGLIIDLRNNGGGYSSLADLMAGRLFAHPFVYGRDYFGARLPQRLWRAVREYQVEPRGRTYTGAVVLLVNSGVASTAETFCVSLVEGRGAKTVGRLTAGSTGRPVVFQLPAGGWARYSTGDFVSSRGLHIEGNGINPDVPVSWSLADFRSGRDPDLAAAVQLLLRGQR